LENFEMKKSLVALAALAATASFAQSTVTITGVVDAGYFATTQPGDYKTNFIGQNGARTTAFKFTGTEDLGGGQQAVFMMEVDPTIIDGAGNSSGLGSVQGTTGYAGTTATSTALRPSGLVGKGESYVGLYDAQYGNIRLGTVNTNTFETFATASQLGTGIGSGYAATNYLITGDITCYASSARYDSPVFLNGFKVGVYKAMGNQAPYGASGLVIPNRNTVVDYSAQYQNGPLTVKYGQLNVQTNATGATAATADKITTTRLAAAAYDAGVAKLSVMTGSVKDTVAAGVVPTDQKLALYSVSVPFMGTYRFIAQTATNTYNNTPTGNVGDKNKTTGLALEKDLSKRTFVYVRNENANVAGSAASGYFAGASVPTALSSTAAWGAQSPKFNITAVGLSHQF